MDPTIVLCFMAQYLNDSLRIIFIPGGHVYVDIIFCVQFSAALQLLHETIQTCNRVVR